MLMSLKAVLQLHLQGFPAVIPAKKNTEKATCFTTPPGPKELVQLLRSVRCNLPSCVEIMSPRAGFRQVSGAVRMEGGTPAVCS